ncbi:MAG: 16S rRNA (uracil(1498)-N(3))-methyltransferase [Bacteroidetes bacterium]|nr:16S rRNA (uracil(1498)-N(3))-methyltransferase [Bacteroidota bacterium]
MKRFFSTDIKGNTALLKDKERDHCVRVLRTTEGEKVEIVDGKGNLYSGSLASSGVKSEVVIHLEGKPKFHEQQVLNVMACAIPKNQNRWELFLEKAVELGVTAIIPLIAHRSEKKHIRRERNEQIMRSAFKQAGHFYLPTLAEPIKLNQLIDQRRNIDEEKFVAYCGEADKAFLGNIHQAGMPSLVLIGPEGDFTPEEVSLARSNGFEIVSLGDSRLRVETAAIVACSAIHFKDQIS